MRIKDMTSTQKTLLAHVRALLDAGHTLDSACDAAKVFGAADADADAVRDTIVRGNRR